MTDTLPPTMDIASLQRLLGEDAWRLTPATMAHKLSGGAWLPAPHLMYIATRIAAGIARGKARIVVSMPPRHGKSELLSTWTPVWALDRDPSTEVVLATYGAELSQEFSRKTRDIMLECNRGDGYANINATIRADVQQVDRFMTTKRGGVRAVGVSGALTGRGADLLLIDDFLKNAKEAASEANRRDIWDWFTTVAMTRLSPTASVIILATRWNLNDLIGMLKTEDPDTWEFIELPCFALEDDLLGREVGEVLWPTRFDKEHMLGVKELLGEYYFQALHQQHPIPSSGSNIKRGDLKIVDIAPAAVNRIQVRSWDLAATADGGDYTAGVKMCLDKISGKTFILDVENEQLGALEVELLTKSCAEEDEIGTSIIIEQEPGSSGKAVIDNYTRHVLSEYSVEGQRPTGDKFVRAQPLYAAIQAGNVVLLRGKWNEKFIDQLVLFPDVVNDDMVDATSQGYNKLHGKRKDGVAWGRGTKSRDNANAPAKQLNKGGIVTGATFGRNKR